MTHKIKAAAYVRVSSEEQTEGWSLDGQEQRLREYADREGYEIVQVYQDETSGSKDKRPGFDRLLMDAHAGLFQTVLVVSTSRFMRSVELARRYKDMLRNKLGIDIIFIDQPSFEPNDPASFMMEGINELFDEYYLHQLRFWTSLGKQTRAQQGLWNGTLPFGYITDKDGVPIPHPENAVGIKLAFEAYSTGRYSDREVAELLNREGYRTTGNWGRRLFTKDTITPLLKNVFYLGYTKYKGEVYPGKHPPLISQELFDKCQEARSKRRAKRRTYGHQKRVYVLAGIARCHICELTLRCYATRSKGQWRYYRHTAKDRGYECSVPSKYIRADVLEPQWGEIVANIKLPKDWQKRIEELAGDKDERASILREREAVQEKLRRLKIMYEDLLIEDSEYRAKRKQFQSTLASLVLPSMPHLVEAGEYLEEMSKIWAAATLAEQRDITRALLEEMYVDIEQDKIKRIKPNPVFRLLLHEVCNNFSVEVL